MAKDPQVDLIFSHFYPRYAATGVDFNDLNRLIGRIDEWKDWCRLWSEEALRQERMGDDAKAQGRQRTAAEAYLRAAIYYHYGKHLFGAHPEEFAAAQTSMLRCYAAGTRDLPRPVERLEIPYRDKKLYGNLRRPENVKCPPVAIILPGLDACKEELHEWTEPFLDRGLATLTLDGPGQGEAAADFPITTQWGPAIGAVLDVLAKRQDVDAERVGIVGQSLGAFYAPLSAAQEPRLKACVANCGPYSFGPVLPQMPDVSQDLFRIRAHLQTREQALAFAHELTLAKEAQNIACPLLIVFGAGDRIIPVSEGQLLADAVKGEVDLVVYEEGNHVCFNIPYKFRPLTADWMAEKLKAIGG
jgi:2,6-dihydroxypseudooxynicotine hydrolase